MINLFKGNNSDLLKEVEDNSIDSVVTDPPYGLKFMNKKWDHSVPSVEFWKEVLRVLKPGGHVLSFGGTRTYHRMAVNIEDAGFEIRDQIMWLYGSGFPKSHNISKAIDKKFGTKGAEYIREDFAKRSNKKPQRESQVVCGEKGVYNKPGHDLAKQWDGFGTALKPANEPIVLARKPLSEKTIVDNVLKHGTGGLNIDGCRVGTDMIQGGRAGRSVASSFNVSIGDKQKMHQGRFPANIILDEEAGKALDEQSGDLQKSMRPKQYTGGGVQDKYVNGKVLKNVKRTMFNDKGGASRFFYCAKASKKERNAGLEGMEEKIKPSHMRKSNGTGERSVTKGFPDTKAQNHHPTVKPIKLMEYLVRLITPPGGRVLDPFMGSGTTGIACKNEGFDFVGIEMSPEYFKIAEGRINGD